jgi:hypothetical protein
MDNDRSGYVANALLDFMKRPLNCEEVDGHAPEEQAREQNAVTSRASSAAENDQTLRKESSISKATEKSRKQS